MQASRQAGKPRTDGLVEDAGVQTLDCQAGGAVARYAILMCFAFTRTFKSIRVSQRISR